MAEPDVILVGAGIMSSTPAVCLKLLEPALSIELFETLGSSSTAPCWISSARSGRPTSVRCWRSPGTML